MCHRSGSQGRPSLLAHNPLPQATAECHKRHQTMAALCTSGLPQKLTEGVLQLPAAADACDASPLQMRAVLRGVLNAGGRLCTDLINW